METAPRSALAFALPWEEEHLFQRLLVSFGSLREWRGTEVPKRWPVSARDRVLVAVDGRMAFRFSDCVVQAQPGYVVCSSANGELSIEADAHAAIACVEFSVEIAGGLPLFQAYPPPRCLRGETAERLRTTIEELSRRSGGEQFLLHFQQTSAVLQMLSALYTATLADCSPLNTGHSLRRRGRPKKLDGDLVVQMISEMNLAARHGHALSVVDLARRFSVSRTWISRAFLEAVGVRPARYLEQLRLARARERLEHEVVSVSEVALSVGYHDPYHFSRVFRRNLGISPSAYRRQHRR